MEGRDSTIAELIYSSAGSLGVLDARLKDNPGLVTLKP